MRMDRFREGVTAHGWVRKGSLFNDIERIIARFLLSKGIDAPEDDTKTIRGYSWVWKEIVAGETGGRIRADEPGQVVGTSGATGAHAIHINRS